VTYRTCTGCVFGNAFCNVRENVKAQVKGLGVTSLKWTCKWKRLAFRPGEAVLVETLAYEPEGDEEFYVRTYPGIAIQNKGSKLICFIVSIGIVTGPLIGSQKGPLPLVASGQRA
jgi:hypothetical protein